MWSNTIFIQTKGGALQPVGQEEMAELNVVAAA